MRKISFLSIILLALAAASCSNKYNETEIRANAHGYLQAVGDYHFDDAIPFCSRHTREQSIPVFKRLMEHADTNYINSNRPSVFTYYDVRRIDDTSARIYYHKHTPIKEVDDSLTLIYEDGHWLADVHLGPIPFINTGNNRKEGRDTSLSSLPRITKDMKRIDTKSIKKEQL